MDQAHDKQPELNTSVVFQMPSLTRKGQALSQQETDFFLENGFLIKERLIEPGLLDGALDRVWQHQLAAVPVAPDADWRLRREDAGTWVNPRWAPQPPHPDHGYHQGRQPVEYVGRMVKLHDIGTAPWLLDLLPRNPVVRKIAKQMLGENLRNTRCCRGVYAIFPTRSEPGSGASELPRLGPHIDQVCQQLNVCAYLDDVPPRNGGFTVYPGSHRIMFGAHRYEANFSPTDGFREAMRRVVAEIEPLELVAPAGSVIFWHGRLVHSAGLHTGDRIRWALFADYCQDRPVLSDEQHKALGQYEWFKDTRLFRDDHVVTNDMWRSWRIG
ncbi:MAG: phytanoyl-CoA dioxygenase family protein [Proteobacteria bacterium]|jgi:hypothetical protein|nr:phytanoyl-CoA dioxygenase family protein [Pseudomonadota bacterium]